MMTSAMEIFLEGVNLFFIVYLMFYATYLFFSVAAGGWQMYHTTKKREIKNEIKHDFYFPVSVLVPAHNEEVTIVESIESLLNVRYRLYEIIIIDDGSTDNTARLLIERFNMFEVDKPIRRSIECAKVKKVYETYNEKVKITLICKENGGKGDALNMGINVSQYPYFVCMDADSMLQYDALERIVQPVMEDRRTVAVGGMVRVPHSGFENDGKAKSHYLTWNVILSVQTIEYDRSFLASRIFMDGFNGNLIISGAFGLFKKDIVIAAGGYDRHTLGEDMELVVRMHVFCRNNKIPYVIKYEPSAICTSEAPINIKDLAKQRRRWHLGMLQTLVAHRKMCMNLRFGLVGMVSYLYYLLYELLFPFIEVFGWGTIALSVYTGLLNLGNMINFYLLYALYGSILSVTAFFQRVYTQKLRVSFTDFLKIALICVVENVFLKFVLDVVRGYSMLGYRKYSKKWDRVERVKFGEYQMK